MYINNFLTVPYFHQYESEICHYRFYERIKRKNVLKRQELKNKCRMFRDVSFIFASHNFFLL